jgi:hypothetical protein
MVAQFTICVLGMPSSARNRIIYKDVTNGTSYVAVPSSHFDSVYPAPDPTVAWSQSLVVLTHISPPKYLHD